MSTPAVVKLPGDPYAKDRVHLKQANRGVTYERFVMRTCSRSHGIRVGKYDICPPGPKRAWNVYPISVEARSISQDLSLEELEERRWTLAKRSWDNKLTPRELLELRWVEARLNAVEHERMSRVTTQRKNLASEKTKLLSSIERLVTELRKS